MNDYHSTKTSSHFIIIEWCLFGWLENQNFSKSHSIHLTFVDFFPLENSVVNNNFRKNNWIFWFRQQQQQQVLFIYKNEKNSSFFYYKWWEFAENSHSLPVNIFAFVFVLNSKQNKQKTTHTYTLTYAMVTKWFHFVSL